MAMKQKYRLLTALCICVGCSMLCRQSHAESGCAVPVKELQAGVFEADLGNIRIKMEEYNKTAKMKVISSLNEDWTSISTEEGVGLISGYLGNGVDATLIAQLVIKQTEDGFDWSVLKVDPNTSKGTAYFSVAGVVKCLQSDLQNWTAAIQQTIGQVTNSSAVNLPNDSLNSL